MLFDQKNSTTLFLFLFFNQQKYVCTDHDQSFQLQNFIYIRRYLFIVLECQNHTTSIESINQELPDKANVSITIVYVKNTGHPGNVFISYMNNGKDIRYGMSLFL